MKDLPLPKNVPLMNIPAGMWPLIGGVGIGAISAYLYGAYALKGDRMTKLEKVCITFVGALCEKIAEMEQQRISLTKKLTETETKLYDETKRADQAEATIREFDSIRAALEKSILELEGKLSGIRQDKRRKGRHAEANKL